MINTNIEKELNNQLNREFFSAYLYLSMAAYFEVENFKGFAHWMKVQAKEEITHAMKFFDYIIEAGGKVILTKIEKPKTTWGSVLEVFKDAYEHETKITNFVYEILNLSKNEKDYKTENFLQWFVREQVEEEAQTLEIVKKLEKIKDSFSTLLVLDHHLSKREG
ncbi:MAG: ferritin [Endomicrobiia bacterium]